MGDVSVGKVWDLDTGVICLDFANTADWHLSAHPEEGFSTYADLVSWNRAEKLLSAAQAKRLLEAADGQPKKAAEAVDQAIELREAFFRILVARLARRSRRRRTSRHSTYVWPRPWPMRA